MQIGDPVQYVTDKAWKYSGQHFHIKNISEGGDVLIGRKRDDLCDVVVDTECVAESLAVVPKGSGRNVAVYDIDAFLTDPAAFIERAKKS